jgi:hypothetical protein
MPAIDRYDGPSFKVLRKYLREGPNDAPYVLILSAKYGLIQSDCPIEDYDVRMSAGLANEMRENVICSLRRSVERISPRELGICLGTRYQNAVRGFEKTLPESVVVDQLGGGLGKRLSALRAWLRE